MLSSLLPSNGLQWRWSDERPRPSRYGTCGVVAGRGRPALHLRLDRSRWSGRMQAVLHQQCVMHGGDDGEDERRAQEDEPLPLAAKHPRITIPKDWLVPPHDTDDEEDTSPVDPFNYDRRVTSFPIGNGAIGLRFSSFDAMTEGSMAAAEGRDVFLIYDPSEGRLRPGGFDLGITKGRYRADGCFRAQMVHLLVADTNKDGLADIGAVKEEIWCPEIGEDEDEVPDGPAEQKKLPSELTNIVEMHLYQQHNVIWYLYTPQGWKLDPDQTGMPDTFSELPLTGIVLSPVDFVGEVLWHSLDPKSWVDSPSVRPHIQEEADRPRPSRLQELPKSPEGRKRPTQITICPPAIQTSNPVEA